jgi:hypothetical protein
LTRLAAFKAAIMTVGEGTRSYAKALLRFRCEWSIQVPPLPRVPAFRLTARKTYLKLKHVLNAVKFFLVSM